MSKLPNAKCSLTFNVHIQKKNTQTLKDLFFCVCLTPTHVCHVEHYPQLW